MEDEKLNVQNTGHNHFHPIHSKNRALGGLVIIVVGILLLLTRIPQTAIYFPTWLFNWYMLLIYFGVYIGALHGFRRSFGWGILILIGLGFLLYQQKIIRAPLSMYVLPAVLIVIGLLLVFRKNHVYRRPYEIWRKKQKRWQQMNEYIDNKRSRFAVDNSDFININSNFRGVEKRVLSKNFQGGSITGSFGSCELDLTHADFEQSTTIDISLNFGSVEIMIPSDWAVQNELSAMLSEVEDSRVKTSVNFEKTLILKGNISFSSVEIKR